MRGNRRSRFAQCGAAPWPGLFIVLSTVAFPTSILADWPEFRGEHSEGIASEAMIPNSWDDTDYAWRRELDTYDVGSPAIIDGKVFYLVSRLQRSEIVLEAVDLASGEQLWSHASPQTAHPLHMRNTLASTTPAADAELVVIAYGDPQHTYLKCLDHAGNLKWSRDFGSWQSQHGFGTSPRIVGSMVLLFNSQQGEQIRPGQTPGDSRMIAVDRSTGETIWETPLTTTRTCYGVPAVYRPEGGREQIIDANTGDGMFGLDAETGKMLWSTKVFEMRCCSTPQLVGDLAIGTSGSGGGGNHLVAVRIPHGNEEPRQVYRIDRGAPYVPTPVIQDDRMFLISDNGIASCVNVATGEAYWQERIGGNFGASPIIVGDKLLVITLDGRATVLRASDTFERLGEIDLGGPVGATPAYSDGRLLLRVGSELRCLAPQAT